MYTKNGFTFTDKYFQTHHFSTEQLFCDNTYGNDVNKSCFPRIL